MGQRASSFVKHIKTSEDVCRRIMYVMTLQARALLLGRARCMSENIQNSVMSHGVAA